MYRSSPVRFVGRTDLSTSFDKNEKDETCSPVVEGLRLSHGTYHVPLVVPSGSTIGSLEVFSGA